MYLINNRILFRFLRLEERSASYNACEMRDWRKHPILTMQMQERVLTSLANNNGNRTTGAIKEQSRISPLCTLTNLLQSLASSL